MNKKEFAIFASAIKALYPNNDKLLPNDAARNLWYEMLRDIPFPVADAGLRKWAATEKWPPTIAEIRGFSLSAAAGDIPDWGSAWRETMDAIARYGYQGEQAAMDALPPMTREVVRRLGWRQLCISENQEADRANFRMVYESLAERKTKDRAISPELRARLDAIMQDGTQRIRAHGEPMTPLMMQAVQKMMEDGST